MDHTISLTAAIPDDVAALAAVDTASATQVIDARPLPCSERRARVFTAASLLAPGQSFLLINDHDPRPLYGHLCDYFQVAWGWAYEVAGPEIYVVRISKPLI